MNIMFSAPGAPKFVVPSVIKLTITCIALYVGVTWLMLLKYRHIPGPRKYAFTKWSLALQDWRGNRTRVIHRLHQQYGPVVRIGPNEVHFNSIAALRAIYGAGSGFGRTSFYRMFDVFGVQNLFTFYSSKQHADRKKVLANAYSKSMIIRPECSCMIEGKVRSYMDYLSQHDNNADEIFTSLHYFSIDTITHFVYGSKHGGTLAVQGNAAHRDLLHDILDPARRKLSWFAVHMPVLTKWMYTRIGLAETVIRPFLPMQKPATYSAIRRYALEAWMGFKDDMIQGGKPNDASVISLLWKNHQSQRPGGLQDLEIASECADHLLAGIDTTADTLMFLIWALSRPSAQKYQKKLIDEVRAMPEASLNEGIPSVSATDKLPYLDAVIKETLRLYAPLPATEPRVLYRDIIIDGYPIPAGTVVGMAPYSLHRNEIVFSDPLKFDPERWLRPDADLAEMKKWFWAFSSGGRMCIGMHLAMAEMTTLTAALYRKYSTSLDKYSEGYAPAITSRFELFFDETVGQIQEHECRIIFRKS